MSCGLRDCVPRALVVLSYGVCGAAPRSPILGTAGGWGAGAVGLESDARTQGSLSRELSDSWPIQGNFPYPRGTRSSLGI